MEREPFAPSVAPQTCVLKMNFACGNCHKKIRKQLQKTQGVHSIHIDANEGKVTVSSTVDPHVLIEEFAKIGKKAHLLWEPRPLLMNQNNADNRGKRVQDAPFIAQQNGIDLDQLAQLQKFAENKRLKLLELNQTNNIKMTFTDNGDISHSDHATDINTNNLHELKGSNGAMNGHNPPPMNTFGQGQYGNIGGASSSRGPAPSGNGSGGCDPTTKNVPPCCHAFEFSCGGNRWGEEKAHRPLLPPNCDPTGPMPAYNHGPYGATPPNHYAPHGPQPVNILHADVNCGGGHKTCRVM
uniref:HMA domain-containing protein n=1 Tax=Populus trichocarpa TaxID=3694 RepID=A0A2K1R4G6_POPTR|eukprot:XP_024449219.1 heavy metal-associated isoprenylated plant protein 32-like [Populus trichocarpa]